MSLHQQAFERGRMVPYRHSVTQLLLPFEKRLIAELGCSEEEYREFIQQVQYNYKERSKEYARIPDIQNTGLEPVQVLIINLGISLILGAAAYLLTPKPKIKNRFYQHHYQFLNLKNFP